MKEKYHRLYRTGAGVPARGKLLNSMSRVCNYYFQSRTGPEYFRAEGIPRTETRVASEQALVRCGRGGVTSTLSPGQTETQVDAS